MELTKEKRIAKEIRRLSKIFRGCDKNKLDVAKTIIERCAFITVSLEDLEATISEEGFVEEYQNGEFQSGVKKSAAAEVHISLTKNLNALTKQLLDIVPPAERKSRLSEMMK